MLAALQEAVLSVDTLDLSPDTTRAQGLEQRLAQRRRSINIRCVNAGTGDCVSCSLLTVSQALLEAERRLLPPSVWKSLSPTLLPHLMGAPPHGGPVASPATRDAATVQPQAELCPAHSEPAFTFDCPSASSTLNAFFFS